MYRLCGAIVYFKFYFYYFMFLVFSFSSCNQASLAETCVIVQYHIWFSSAKHIKILVIIVGIVLVSFIVADEWCLE